MDPTTKETPMTAVSAHRRRPALLVAIGLCVALLSLPAAAAAADTYVDDDSGNDANACVTTTAPCATIAAGLSKAGAGDTVRVDGGLYAEILFPAENRSLLAEDFNAGDGDSDATIDGGAGIAVSVLPGQSAGAVEGFTIHSDLAAVRLEGPAAIVGNTFDDPVAGFGVAVQLLEGSGGASVTGNIFTDTVGDTDEQIGVESLTSGSTTISGNSFENLRTAVRVSGGEAVVSANTIVGTRTGANVGIAILVFADSSPIIADNLVHSPDPADVTTGIGIFENTASEEDTGATLRRNRVFDHMTGIDVRDTTGAVTLEGDTVAGANVGLFVFDDAPTAPDEGDVSATNVTVFDNTTSIRVFATDLTLDSGILGTQILDQEEATCQISFSRGPLAAPGGSGCDDFQTTAAPGFVAPGEDDYHLKPASPLLDAGNPIDPPPGAIDLDGDPRALDATPACSGDVARRDIGADEFAPPLPECAPPPAPAPPAPPSSSHTSQPAPASMTAVPLGLRIRGRRLRVDRRRVVRLRLTCVSAKPACVGKLALRTRRRLRLRGRPGDRRVRIVLARRAFRIAAGRTRVLKLRLSPRRARLVRNRPSARAALAKVRAHDAAGHRRIVRKRLRLVPRPKR